MLLFFWFQNSSVMRIVAFLIASEVVAAAPCVSNDFACAAKCIPRNFSSLPASTICGIVQKYQECVGAGFGSASSIPDQYVWRGLAALQPSELSSSEFRSLFICKRPKHRPSLRSSCLPPA